MLFLKNEDMITPGSGPGVIQPWVASCFRHNTMPLFQKTEQKGKKIIPS
jgi:hypothetical protein